MGKFSNGVTIPDGTITKLFGANSADEGVVQSVEGVLLGGTLDPSMFGGNLVGFATRVGYMSSATPPIFTADANWLSSAALPVAAGDTLSYDVVAASGMRIFSFHAADGSFISGVSGSGFNSPHSGRIAIPANAVSMIFSMGNPAVLTSEVVSIYYNEATRYDAPPDLEARSGNLLAQYSRATGFVNTSGGLSGADANWLRTDPFPVKAGRFITYDCVGGAGMNLVSFYDASDVYMSGIPGHVDQKRVRGVVEVPAGAATARAAWGNIDNPSNTLGWGPPWASVAGNTAFTTAFLYSALYPTFSQPVVEPSATIVLYGDSRFSTDYPFVATAWAERFGCTVLAKGLSGHTVEQLASDADLSTVFSGAAPRLLGYMPGGNDTGASSFVGTFDASSPNGVGGESVVSPLALATATPSGATFIQNVDLTIQKMIAQYGNVRSRAGIGGGDSEAAKSAKLSATTKVEILLITDLPQIRNNSGDGYSQPANWERKRQAILEVAAFRKVRCLDFQGEYPIDMSIEPYFVAPTDTVTNSGNLYMDGLHPNEVLAQLVADRAYGVVE